MGMGMAQTQSAATGASGGVGGVSAAGNSSSELMVSSSNEMVDVADLPFSIKAELVADDDEDGVDEAEHQHDAMMAASVAAAAAASVAGTSASMSALTATTAATTSSSSASSMLSHAQQLHQHQSMVESSRAVERSRSIASAVASETDHGRISSSANELEAATSGMNSGMARSMAMAAAAAAAVASASSAAGLNNNMDARNFILKVCLFNR